MIDVQFPAHSFRFKEESGRRMMFDECRRKWLVFTPEEWVRQNFIQYLKQVKDVPMSLIAVEKEIQVGDMKKRFDIVVYRGNRPWMVVECKEMNVQLDEKVIRQVLNYNRALEVAYLVITNGTSTFAMRIHDGAASWVDDVPVYQGAD